MRNSLLTVVLAGFLSQGAVAAQVTEPTTYRLTGTRVALAQDVHIERDEEVTDVAVVVGGSLVVDGRVRDGIVVVGGNLRLTATSDVRGDIVLVGGPAGDDEIVEAMHGTMQTAMPGASIGRADVAGVLGHRWAVAYGLVLLSDQVDH